MLRASTPVEVASTADAGELDSVLHRRGQRMIVVAGGDGSLHAVVAALHRRHELADAVVGLLPLGHRQRLRPRQRHPARPRGGRAGDRGRRRPPGRRDRRLRRRDRGQQRARRRRCRGQPQVHDAGRNGSAGPATSSARCWPRSSPPFCRFRVEVDGEVVADMDRHVVQVAIGNGTTVGGGTDADARTPTPEDGKLDVMVSFAVGAAGPVRLRRQAQGRSPPGARRRASTCAADRGR